MEKTDKKNRAELLTDQQQAIKLIVTEFGSMERAATAIGVSSESLFNWRSGRHLAQGLTRRKLFRMLENLPRLDQTDTDESVRPTAVRGGSRIISPENVKRHQKKLAKLNLEPPDVRVETVSRLLANSGLTRKLLAARLEVHANTLQDYLNPAYESLMKLATARKIKTIEKNLEKRKSGWSDNSPAERLGTALKTLLGKELVKSGFKKRDKRRIIIAEKLSRVTGLHTRTIRRYLPIIDLKINRRFSPHVIEAFEKAASELGNIADD